MKNEGSVEIDRPIDEVFTYTNEKVAEWSLVVVEDVPLDEKPDGVGTRFLCVTEERGSRMEFEGTVTRWEPPTLSAIELVGKQFDIEAEYTFEDLGGRTRVTQTSKVTPKGIVMKLFFGCFGWLMKKSGCDAANKELASLKDHMENSVDQNA